MFLSWSIRLLQKLPALLTSLPLSECLQQPRFEKVHFEIQKFSSLGKCRGLALSSITPGIPWGVHLVRKQLNARAVLYPGFLKVMISMAKDLLYQPRGCLCI